MNAVVAIVGLIVGAQGFWSLLQAWLNRGGTKATVAQASAKIEIEKEKTKTDSELAETNRLKALAESQIEAQQTALNSWQGSWNRLHEDYLECDEKLDDCRKEIRIIHDTASNLVDVFAGFVARMRASADESSGIITIKVTGPEFLELRKTISDARINLK